MKKYYINKYLNELFVFIKQIFIFIKPIKKNKNYEKNY